MDEEQQQNGAWGRDLALREAMVLHEPSLVVGRVKKYWDGVDETFVSPINGVPVPSPVLELDGGHALLAVRDSFVELDAGAARFFAALQAGLSGLVVVSAKNAAASGVSQDVGLALTAAALRAQLSAIGADR